MTKCYIAASCSIMQHHAATVFKNAQKCGRMLSNGSFSRDQPKADTLISLIKVFISHFYTMFVEEVVT
jgi:hypothetical protein